MSQKRLFLLFDCGFLFLFLVSLVAVVVRPDIYARPVAYFILTCLTVGMVAAETIIVPEEHTRTALSLVKILLIGASLRLIPQLLYPGLFGIDPWMHQAITSNLLDLGRIPSGTGYSNLPVFHLIAASVSLLTGLDYKMSVMTSIGFFNIFSPIFIFLIGKRLSSVRLGLLGARARAIKKLYTDHLYADALYDWKTPKYAFDFSQAVINENFSGLRTIALRKAVAEAPFYIPSYLGEYKLSYDITPVLNSNFNRVFDSETVFLYSRPNAIGR